MTPIAVLCLEGPGFATHSMQLQSPLWPILIMDMLAESHSARQFAHDEKTSGRDTNKNAAMHVHLEACFSTEYRVTLALSTELL